MRRGRLVRSLASVVLLALAVVACNAVIGNEDRVLRGAGAGPDASPAEAGTPEDASSDAGGTLTGDAGPDCLGGERRGGICRPVLFAASPPAVTLAVANGTLYFGGAKTTRWCDLRGCDVAQGEFGSAPAPLGLAADATTVVTAGPGGVRAFAHRGAGAGTTLSTRTDVVAVALDADSVYFTTRDSAVHACARPACAGGARHMATAWPPGVGGAVGVDASRVYWATVEADGGTGIHEVRKDATGGQPMSSALAFVPRTMSVVDGSMYYAGTGGFWNGEVIRVTGGLQVSRDFVAVRAGDPWGVTAEGDRVWYTVRSDGTVRSCPRDACRDGGAPLADGQTDPRGIAVTAAAVFWADLGRGVMALAR